MINLTYSWQRNNKNPASYGTPSAGGREVTTGTDAVADQFGGKWAPAVTALPPAASISLPLADTPRSPARGLHHRPRNVNCPEG